LYYLPTINKTSPKFMAVFGDVLSKQNSGVRSQNSEFRIELDADAIGNQPWFEIVVIY
jgi:hypothetical protein